MPNELKNITGSVMKKIHRGEIKMRSKVYYIFGSILAMSGLVVSIIVTLFFVSLTRFMFRTHGPMGQFRLEQLLSSFPLWAPIFSVLSLVVGLRLLRKYDFAYKKNPWMVIFGFIVMILIAGFVIDTVGLNDVWLRQGPMKGVVRQYLQENSVSGVR